MDWNAIVTAACCLATLVLTGMGVVVWFSFRQVVSAAHDAIILANELAIKVRALEIEIENTKSNRSLDAQENNRRFSEISEHLQRIEKMVGQILMRRRSSDTDGLS